MRLFNQIALWLRRSPTVDERLVKHWEIMGLRNYSDKTIQLKKHYSRLLLEKFGKQRIHKIDRHELKEWLIPLSKKTPSHTRSLLIFIRDFFQEAVIDGLIKNNPTEHIRLPPIRVRRKRLTKEEFLRMLNRIPDDHYLKLAMKLAITTAQRRADIATMQFTDVWDGFLHVIQQKGQRFYEVRIQIPLHFKSPLLDQTLGEIIDECRARSLSNWMLENKHRNPVKEMSLTTSFQHYRDNPEIIDEPSFHEIRSLAERVYKEIGMDPQILLGHKNRRMTETYDDPRGLPAYRPVPFPVEQMRMGCDNVQ